MFILQLNPMMGNYETLVAVACAYNPDALRTFVESEKVEPYTDGDGLNMCGRELRKCFRKGGPLEYLNPPDRDECIVDVGTEEDWAAKGRQRFLDLTLSLLFVGEGHSLES